LKIKILQIIFNYFLNTKNANIILKSKPNQFSRFHQLAMTLKYTQRVRFIVFNNLSLICAASSAGTAVAMVFRVFVNTFNRHTAIPPLCLRVLTTQTTYVKTTSLTDACAS